MKLTLTQLVRLENCLKDDTLVRQLSMGLNGKVDFSTQIGLNDDILAMVHAELEAATMVIPAARTAHLESDLAINRDNFSHVRDIA